MRKNIPFLVIVALALAILNFVTAVVANSLQMPFFLDTWATSLGSIIAGPLVGSISGALYNILMAFTLWSPPDAVWAYSSITVAVTTWLLWRRGWLTLHQPSRILLSGLVIALVNSVVTIAISFVFYSGMPSHEPTAPIYAFIFDALGSATAATVVHNVLVEIADKVLSLFLAVNVAQSFPKGFSGK